MMKSAASSAGFAPLTCAMQSGALSMIAGMALLHGVAPALRAHGPLHGPAHDGEHEHERDDEAQHGQTFLAGSRSAPLAVGSPITTDVTASVPSGSITCSAMTPISG